MMHTAQKAPAFEDDELARIALMPRVSGGRNAAFIRFQPLSTPTAGTLGDAR
jgi:hypothetical protein